MPGKQAKILNTAQIKALLRYASNSRHPARNRVMVLLSVKAGLRACEISNLTWSMILDSSGRTGSLIELHDEASKNRSGRHIPIHPALKASLIKLRKSALSTGPVLVSERGCPLAASSVVNWFHVAFKALALTGCSSHSGRRTFITKAARKVHLAGGSLRDVQELAGHKSIEMTQAYIDGDTAAKRRLVSLI